ncbi:extracellular solute-binding protein [Paenibacillus radicis (ex Gao et al. 2016)]|uniref:Sugar ABC transporter substrate-binding protein n=1 Tax=Paenibacillus radicis (ex Gao et al. 2016) TaxID=1737354 RepID=A0A917HGB8_9BACL|nr:extracellular solute-binding protein [Paenibacillus radicis (ex Gao et al. 2016)]GGG78132.1 sugar ABC transporter substrate-binding protein [Paenibacillus radicis (ex Gao et al. 2016)]
MRNSWKKVLLLSLVTVLTFTLAACSGSNNNKPSNSPTAAPTEGTDNGAAATDSGVDATGWDGSKYTTPVTLSTVKGIGTNYFFKNGETMENNVLHTYMKDNLGIDVKYDWVVTDTNDAYKTKLRLMLSSGEKMPDVVTYRGDLETVNMLIDSGQFMDVGEVFDKFAGDKYKQAVDLNADTWLPVVRDGKRMALPVLDYAYNDDMVLWLRQDWMDKLNLQAPKTVADLEVIMDAFVNQDPDGNGKKDTLGLALGFKNTFLNWMSDVSWLFGAYGTMPGQWNKGADGALAYGSIDPGAKQALATLKTWMDKGYISKDSGLKDDVSGSEFFTKGQAGAIVGRNWLPDWPFGDLINNVPGAKYKAYPIPAGPDGKIGAQSGNPSVNGWMLINKNAKNPEALIRYYNFFFDNWANPEKGSTFENGFAEGYDWAKLPDGTITKEPEKYPDLFKDYADRTHLVEPIYYSLTFEGARIPSLYADTMIKLGNGEAPTTPYESQTAAVRKPENVDAMKIVMEQKDIRMKNYFQGPLTETMKQKNELLNKLLNQTYSKIIYGQSPIDEFDKMVDNWKKSGGEQITKEVNEWFASASK